MISLFNSFVQFSMFNLELFNWPEREITNEFDLNVFETRVEPGRAKGGKEKESWGSLKDAALFFPPLR